MFKKSSVNVKRVNALRNTVNVMLLTKNVEIYACVNNVKIYKFWRVLKFSRLEKELKAIRYFNFNNILNDLNIYIKFKLYE